MTLTALMSQSLALVDVLLVCACDVCFPVAAYRFVDSRGEYRLFDCITEGIRCLVRARRPGCRAREHEEPPFLHQPVVPTRESGSEKVHGCE
eukprot:2096627-Prymnesium_polylepis.1